MQLLSKVLCVSAKNFFFSMLPVASVKLFSMCFCIASSLPINWIMCPWKKCIGGVFVFVLYSGISSCSVGGFHCQKNSHKLSVELLAVAAAAVPADF